MTILRRTVNKLAVYITESLILTLSSLDHPQSSVKDTLSEGKRIASNPKVKKTAGPFDENWIVDIRVGLQSVLRKQFDHTKPLEQSDYRFVFLSQSKIFCPLIIALA